MKRRNFIKKLINTTLLGFTSGTYINPALSFATTPAPSVTTNLRILYPSGALKNIQVPVKSFEALENIKIDLIEAPLEDISTRMIIENNIGTHSFDIALPTSFSMPDLVEQDLLYDFTDRHEQYKDKIGYDQCLYQDADEYKGRMYGYQTDGDVYLSFYNQELSKGREKEFEDFYSISFKTPETWDELDKHMAFFNAPENDVYGGCLYRSADFIHWEWWMRFHALGGSPFDTKMNSNVYNDIGLHALESLMKASNHQHPASKNMGLYENWDVFQQKKCYANLGWGGTQKYLKTQAQKTQTLEQDQFYKTQKTPGVSYFNWGWNYVISKQSHVKDLAYKFCAHAISNPISSNAVAEPDGFFDPFRIEHYNHPKVIQSYGQEFLEQHKSSMSHSISDLYLSGNTGYFTSLKQCILSADRGEISPESALKILQQQWDQITNERGKDKQLEQWTYLIKRQAGVK